MTVQVSRPSPSVTRRQVLGAMALSSAAAACAPASAPAVASPPPQAPAAGKPAWEAEWDQLVAKARQEGKLNIMTLTGVGQRKRMDAFQKAFPGIEANLQEFSSASQIAPKVIAEQKAGVFEWDMADISPTTALQVMRPANTWDPIRPLFFRPDVLGDENWHGGFEEGFIDTEKKWAYGGDYIVSPRNSWINTDLVPEGSIKSVTDLLDPRWKGKILIADVRTGYTFFPMNVLRVSRPSDGESIMKRLLVDQEPTFLRDTRQITEAMARGKYAILASLGLEEVTLTDMQKEGVGKNLKPIEIPEFTYGGAAGSMFLYQKAPHPNAAKLYVNWVFTKEGQIAYQNGPDPARNSRRKDVPVYDKSTFPDPTRKVYNNSKESSIKDLEVTQKILEQLVGLSNR
ncbi:MAG: ABC transporter substrate-binding protein [Dehalococcoidia bacterium]|nr:ABC transporter substrate-binding protein [Dehalococcoidia bacterium]